MKTSTVLNLVGLGLITTGSLGAALGTPSPGYQKDGSVMLDNIGKNTGDAAKDRNKRVRMHYLQRAQPYMLGLIAIGAALQALALLLPE